MTIRLTRGKLTGVGLSLMAGTLMLAAASDGYAGPRGGKGDSGRLVKPPQSIKPPPGPNVRDHRGEKTKLRPPPSCRGGGGPLCNPNKTIVRDHRTPQSPRGQYGFGGKR